MSYLKQFLPADAIAFSGPNNPDYTEGATKDQGYRNTTTGELFTFDGLYWAGSQTGRVPLGGILDPAHPNLKALYLMDSVTDNILVDSSAAGSNSGTLAGSPLPTLVTGAIGQAVFFDGTTNTGGHASIPRSLITGSTQFAFSLWIKKPADSASVYGILNCNSGALSGLYGLECVIQNSTLIAKWKNGDSGDTIGLVNTSLSGIQTGEWFHATFNFGTVIGYTNELYINGVLSSSSAASETIAIGTYTLKLGGSLVNSFGSANTALDQVRFFDRHLVQSEITELYQESILSFNHPDLVVAYTMDVQVGSALIDQGPNGYDGTISGAFQIAGQMNNALQFAGGDGSDYVDLGLQLDSVLEGASAKWSLSFLMANSSFGSSDYVFAKHGDTRTADPSHRGLIVRGSTGGQPSCYIENNTGGNYREVRASAAVGDGVFHHVVLNYDATQSLAVDRIKWFVDGIASTSVEIASAGVIPTVGNSAKSAIGSMLGVAGPAFAGFSGKLDQMRLFSRLLTQEEVATLFAETGL